MPRNRQTVPRERRVAELVTAAGQLFLERGYSATTMAQIARAAEVTPTTLYWYFPSKDHAFVAVLERLLAEEQARIQGRPELRDDPVARLLAVLRDLEAYPGLQPVVHERAPKAPVVAEFHDRLHGWLDGLLADALRHRLPDEQERALAAQAVAAMLDGALGHNPGNRPLTEVVGFVLARIAPGGAGADPGGRPAPTRSGPAVPDPGR
jgi:TetR/AcrR family transcriptional regulator, repressor of the mexAB-oprM multidrug resistance operon